MKAIMNFVESEDGATAMEYGLMAALFAAVILGAVSHLGLVISNTFTNVSDAINTAS